MVALPDILSSANYLSWSSYPSGVLALICLPAFVMIFWAALLFRVPVSPRAFAVIMAVFFLCVSTITAVQADSLPLVPESQYEYGMELIMLPLGHSSFVGLIRPEHSWSFLLCPLVMLLTGFRSARGAAEFFPYAFVRCMQLTHFVFLCIWSVYIQARGGKGGGASVCGGGWPFGGHSF